MATTKDTKRTESGRVSYGGNKKFAVLARQGDQVKLVRFGDPNMTIKKNIPERRASFRARHKCSTAKDKLTPRYWSCKAW